IHYFISDKLFPSSSYSGVTKERVVLSYAILKGLTVDVGKVIQSSKLHIARGSTVVGLGHSTLIYELCRQTDVPTHPGEVVVYPKGTLTWTIISHYHIPSQEELKYLQQDVTEPPQPAGPSAPPLPATNDSSMDWAG
ncbi:hypothetical protein TorRG33x02_275910, partial [Trema orientale]